MGKTYEELIAERSPERRERVEARAAELIAEEKSLRNLRGRVRAREAAANLNISAARAKNADVPPEELEDAIERTLTEVRAARHRKLAER